MNSIMNTINNNIKLEVINYKPIYKQVFLNQAIPLVRIQMSGNIITQTHPSKYTQIPIKHSYDLQCNCVKIINWSMINIAYYRPRKKYYVYSNPYLKYIDIIMGCKDMYDIDITIIIVNCKTYYYRQQ